MSVLVKGMEMPESCRECRFQDFGSTTGDTWCGVKDIVLAKNFEVIGFDGKPDWCPLVALPDKHGRLVDADALITEWKDVLKTDGISPMFAMVVEGCIRDVERAKVVVEAEGEK